MADGIVGHALATALRYLATLSSESTQDNYPFSFTDAVPSINDVKPSTWSFFNNFPSFSPPSSSVVVVGQSSSALITLIELANQFSPEFLLILLFCGVVGILTFILYIVVKALLFMCRPVRRYFAGTETQQQADLSQLSDAARQVYALVQLQNPGLFAQSPVPINTPRRNRAPNSRRR